MSQEYNAMSQMPSHGNASNARVANGREGFQRGGSLGRDVREAGGALKQLSCQFGPAPPRRDYCQAAPFSSMTGQRYFTLSQAYGQSVPATSNY